MSTLPKLVFSFFEVHSQLPRENLSNVSWQIIILSIISLSLKVISVI